MAHCTNSPGLIESGHWDTRANRFVHQGLKEKWCGQISFQKQLWCKKWRITRTTYIFRQGCMFIIICLNIIKVHQSMSCVLLPVIESLETCFIHMNLRHQFCNHYVYHVTRRKPVQNWVLRTAATEESTPPLTAPTTYLSCGFAKATLSLWIAGWYLSPPFFKIVFLMLKYITSTHFGLKFPAIW